MDRVMRAGKIVCTHTLFVPGSPATYEIGERSPNLSWRHHLKVADRTGRIGWPGPRQRGDVDFPDCNPAANDSDK